MAKQASTTAPTTQGKDLKSNSKFRIEKMKSDQLDGLLRSMSEVRSHFYSANAQVINLVGAANNFFHADDKRVKERAEDRADDSARAIRMYLTKAKEGIDAALSSIA